MKYIRSFVLRWHLVSSKRKCFGFIRDLPDSCQAACVSDFLTPVKVFCKIKKLKVIHVSHYDYMPPGKCVHHALYHPNANVFMIENVVFRRIQRCS